MAGFKDAKREKRLRKVAKEKGIRAVVLSASLRSRMTAKKDRPLEAMAVGVEDPQRTVVLSYAWCVEQLGKGESEITMAKMADVCPVEMLRVLDSYRLWPDTETIALCKGQGRRR